MTNKQSKHKETKEKPEKSVPDDQSNVRVDSFIKIYDPESKQIYLETRA